MTTPSPKVGSKPTAEQVREGLEWCRDWRDGQFTPAHTKDGWSVEMYGLVGDYEDLARAYLGLLEIAREVLECRP